MSGAADEVTGTSPTLVQIANTFTRYANFAAERSMGEAGPNRDRKRASRAAIDGENGVGTLSDQQTRPSPFRLTRQSWLCSRLRYNAFA